MVPGNDSKQSPVMLGLWGMRSTPLLPSLPGPLLPLVVTPDRVLSIDKIKLNDIQIEDKKYNMLN